LTARRHSPAVERLATLCGAVGDSFQKGSELLKEAAGVRLSESTVRRTTQATGNRIATHVQKGRTFGGKVAWDWFGDACGRTVGYIQIDATGVRQQGPQGVRAEGRMAYVGLIANPLPDRERVFEGLPKSGASMKARYVSGLYPLAEMGPLLRRQGAQVGLDRAEVWVAITDGGGGLEDFVRANFPRVEAVILDFYHAATHLKEAADAVHGAETPHAKALFESWKTALKEDPQGAKKVIRAVRYRRDQAEGPARKTLTTVAKYLASMQSGMEYHAYKSMGLPIGSGVVEAACKTLVNERLKQSGMRWTIRGGQAILTLRSHMQSDRWENAWRLLARSYTTTIYPVRTSARCAA